MRDEVKTQRSSRQETEARLREKEQQLASVTAENQTLKLQVRPGSHSLEYTQSQTHTDTQPCNNTHEHTDSRGHTHAHTHKHTYTHTHTHTYMYTLTFNIVVYNGVNIVVLYYSRRPILPDYYRDTISLRDILVVSSII